MTFQLSIKATGVLYVWLAHLEYLAQFLPIWIVLNGQAPLQSVSNNLPLLALAGVLVGFGSVLGNGCTSGHGICGLGRLSVRSLVATSVFMATGVITVAAVRHLFGSIL